MHQNDQKEKIREGKASFEDFLSFDERGDPLFGSPRKHNKLLCWVRGTVLEAFLATRISSLCRTKLDAARTAMECNIHGNIYPDGCRLQNYLEVRQRDFKGISWYRPATQSVV